MKCGKDLVYSQEMARLQEAAQAQAGIPKADAAALRRQLAYWKKDWCKSHVAFLVLCAVGVAFLATFFVFGCLDRHILLMAECLFAGGSLAAWPFVRMRRYAEEQVYGRN